jgi:hypothetical protein
VTSATKKDLTIMVLLLVLGVVPMLGGLARLGSLAEPATDESARFVASPTPIVLHVAGAAVYSLLGALQFSALVRRRFPGWHRRAGKLIAAAGLLTAATGLQMAAFYAIPGRLQGPLLQALRLLVGAGTMLAIIRGTVSILRRNVPEHEAWMIRAYALAQGAGTQVFFLGLPMLFVGEIVGLTRDLLMGLAWAVNLGVAEWIIRRRSVTSRRGLRLDLAPPA